MTLEKNDHDTMRRYLLHDMTDEEEAVIEQRLLSDDAFFHELEVIREELVDEFVAQQLTAKERASFKEGFLASPAGKNHLVFARTLSQHVASRSGARSKSWWTDRFNAFWTNRTNLLKTAAAFGGIVLVASILLLSRPGSPQNYVTHTLASSSITRGDQVEEKILKLEDQGLRAILLLPSPAASETKYRAQLLNDKGEVENSVGIAGSDAKSVTVEIPAKSLPPGRYVLQLYEIGSDATHRRIPGNYHFTVE